MLQHALSRFADADIIIMAACGERANEVVEILPSSRNWKTLVPVVSCKRTTIIANTSNMPVAAVRRPCTRL